MTSEGGGTAAFTVVLNTQPTADVTIGLSSYDTTEGTVSPVSLIFTSVNWNAPQTVTVTGVDDTDVDGTIDYDINTAAATSADANYNGVDPSDVSVSNNDNDVQTATNAGIASFTPNNGIISNLTALAQTACAARSGYSFPFGFFSFTVNNVAVGSTVTITITLPSNIAVGAQYWKCINGQWVDVTSLLGDNDGDNILTLTITDGGLGDADGTGNGIISDPGGPAVVTTSPAPAFSPQSPANAPSSSPQMPERFISSPAKLSVKYLNVQPQRAQANQPVTVYANIANGGDEAGKYTATLKINGQVEETRTGKIGGHAAVPLKFEVIRDKAGTYNIDINGQQAYFTIVGKQSSTGSSKTIPLIGFVICAIGVIIVSALLIRRMRTGY